MKKFLARTGSFASITEVEVQRETNGFVYVNGRRNNKLGSCESYHDTKELAKQHLIDLAQKTVDDSQRRLEWAISQLEKVKNL